MILDEPMLSLDDTAILLGVTPEALRDLHRKQTSDGSDVVYLPEIWVERGRRRAAEAKAATGSTDVHDAITYLRERDSA